MNQTLNPTRCLLCFTAVAVLVFMLIGCQTANYGNFRHNKDVGKVFISGEPLAGHTYYYAGSNVRPDAIMAIDQKYTLADKLWTRIDDPGKELKTWFNPNFKMLSAYTYYILTPDGDRIGIYYSRWNTGFVKMEENNQVTISLPDKDADKERSRRTR